MSSYIPSGRFPVGPGHETATEPPGAEHDSPASLRAKRVFLIYTGYRIGKGTSRLPFSRATAICGFGAFTLGGGGAIVLGAFLLGMGF
jgi:hypothetical protein